MARRCRVSAVIAISVQHVCYLGCGRIRTYDVLIVDIGVIDARTDGQTFLFQLVAMLAEQLVD